MAVEAIDLTALADTVEWPHDQRVITAVTATSPSARTDNALEHLIDTYA
jgi:hypothetical protein